MELKSEFNIGKTINNKFKVFFILFYSLKIIHQLIKKLIFQILIKMKI